MLVAKRSWIAILILAVGGCGAGAEKEVTGAWAAEWEDARKNASSEFEKAVLADGEITQDEYVEALDLYVECIHEKGAEVALEEVAGVFQYHIGRNVALYDSVADECSKGTTWFIEPLHLHMQSNPDKLPWNTVIANCLVERGVADEGFTGNDFEELWKNSVANDDGSYSDPIANQILGSIENRECMMNPSYRG